MAFFNSRVELRTTLGVGFLHCVSKGFTPKSGDCRTNSNGDEMESKHSGT